MIEQNTNGKDTFFLSLKNIMQTKGINQKELAKRTDTEDAQVSRWMNGVMNPSYEKMKKIADALDCHIELIPKENKDFEAAYFAGFEYGGQIMLKDIIKMLKGMKWYGGDKQAQRTDRMSGDHAGRTADMQQELERAGAEGRDGGRLVAMPAED